MPDLNYDTIVVGGGILGASTAYHLVSEGARTLLVDRHDPGRATSAGAGILAPEMNRRDPGSWFDFAVQAVDYYPELVNRLAEDGAGDTSYARCGMLLVAADEQEMAEYTLARDEILERRRRRGTPSEEDLFEVTAAEAWELCGVLGSVHGALYFRHAARVDGRRLSSALRRAAIRRGLAEQNGEVQRLLVEGGRVTGAVVDDREIGAGAVIVCAGAWSALFGAQLGVTLPVEPQRGQIIHWDLSPQPTGEWPIVGAFRGHYIVCWPGGRVVTGATRETDSGHQPYTTAQGLEEVVREALRVAPGLSSARLLEVRVGLRPMSPDGLPILGSLPDLDGIYLATGNGPTGLQLGPFSGKVAAAMALDKEPPTDVSAFNIRRFL